MLIFESEFPEDFRASDIQKILNFAANGKSCQVICLPGVGKATVLRLLAHNRGVLKFHLGLREKNLRVIYVNFFELRDFDEVSIVKFLLTAMDQEASETNDEMALTKNLTETVNKLVQAGQNLVFLFDHFDEHQNKLPRSFFQMLKSLNNLAKYKFAVVFATRRDLSELLDAEIVRDYWTFFVDNAIYLKVFDEKAVEVLFAQIEKAFARKLDPERKRLIINLTGGHAKLTKIACELTLQQNFELKMDDLSQNRQINAALSEIWLFLTAQEQKALHSITKGTKDMDSKVLETLMRFDIVDEKLNFTITLFKEFVKTQIPDSGEKISFNKDTKEISKGKSVISELLSPQEYRLMKFLIENQGKIVERDELITAVWPQTKVAEAVSDEAIDQMIFRLRKKIEDDPKNPKHIQTVKGRGLRFEP